MVEMVQYTIQAAARKTGLSEHVLRVWEQRYAAVTPNRTPGKRRLYTAAQLERLGLLRDLTRGGHRISQVARVATPKLRRLTLELATPPSPAEASPRPDAAADGPPDTTAYQAECLAAVQALDATALEQTLLRATGELSALGLLRHLVGPLLETIGERWREGRLTVAQEHCASAALRHFLLGLARTNEPAGHAPLLLVATPAGQSHELGALLAAAAAVQFGWRIAYLGAGMPAADLAGAARQLGARAVAVSLVYPTDDPELPIQLRQLQRGLPAGVALLVGGRALPAYESAVRSAGGIAIGNLGELGAVLDELRRQPGTGE